MSLSQPDVLDLLMQEHRDAESLLDTLRTSTDGAQLRDLADVLILNLVRHSVAEEMYVYPLVKEYLSDGAQAVAHDLDEHQELERLLKDLEGLDADDPAFFDVLQDIEATLADHIADEEREQFPRLRLSVPDERLIDLRGKVLTAERLAPTRPHPAAPNSPLFHKVVGPGVGLVDRLRDALSGRMVP